MAKFDKRLGGILVNSKLLTEEKFAEAMNQVLKDHSSLSTVVLEQHLVNDRDFIGAVAREINLPPVDITFGASTNTVDLAITSLLSQANGSGALKTAGITATAGAAGAGAITFTSARGEKFNVQVTGDTANKLGFGAYMAGTSSAPDYTTVTGGVAYDKTVAFGNSGLQISLNGAGSNGNTISVNLEAGNATAGSISATATGGATGDTITFTLDGGATTTVTLTTAEVGSASMLATKINASASALVTASVNSAGRLTITNVAKGAHSMVIGGTLSGYTGITGGATVTGLGRTGADLASALTASFTANSSLQAAGLTATSDGSDNITIASSNGTFFRVASWGAVNLGFGTNVSAFAGPTVGNTLISARDSQGATNTTAINYTALTNGSDDQGITVSANNTAGALQTMTITLHNDTTARTGRSIDETVNYINTQLQQSNNPTLQKIVAVKERSGSTEQINFLSSLASFSVGLGSTANADGLNAGAAASENSALLGSGANVSIDSKSNALVAVAAVATAVTTLGSAQAAVGKGMNQLNYAVGLAQSQISNFSAAESRIRDADVASEAANLTKAQVLQQASIAAMAQANSAPQAVLALLRA